MEKNFVLEIASLVGEPINTQLPVPVEIDAIADTATAKAGEHVWRYSAMEGTADVILDIDASGDITVKKRDPLGDVELTFKGLNSKLEYVLVDDILGSPDTQVLGRRRASLIRGMDKREVKLILDAILAKTAGYLPGVNPHEYTVQSGDDLYDALIGMKHLVEDYGDNYSLLVGTTVKEKIDTYDKDKAGTFNYNVTLTAKLKELGISVTKIFGQVSVLDNETEVDLMDKKKAILVAKNSTIAEGKPIKFVRRVINPDIAELMGADVDSAQRATIVNPTPVVVSGTNKLAYGVYGYESIIFCITNPKAIVISDLTTVVS